MAGEPYSDMKIEDVSSLMRIERASGQLSDVRRDLYPAMLALQEKVAREFENMDVESLDYELGVDRRKKLISNIKLVVEYRMNKVAAMAVRGAMGTINVIDHLPPEERIFYEEVLEASKKLWNAPHRKKKTTHIPELVPEEPEVPAAPAVVPAAPVVVETIPEPPTVPDTPTEMMEPPDDMADIMYPDEPPAEETAEIPPIPEEELGEAVIVTKQPEAAAEESNGEDNPDADCFDMVTVRITENVEPFAGTERDYSLKKEDVVMLPKSLASILVGRKLAVILNI